MSSTTILVVEDEVIVAMDLQQRLGELGYRVVGTAVSGAEALQQARTLTPELVLMDIRLQGPMDGIEAATEIRRQYNTPVVYLTAHSDEPTLGRAKLTEPVGYLLKPVEDRELQIAIEMALYKHQMDSKLRQMERWLATTLASIGDGVITIDRNRRVTYMNPVAAHFTECSAEEAYGRVLEEVLPLLHRDTKRLLELPVHRVLEDGMVIGLAAEAMLRTRSDREFAIAGSLSPLLDEHDTIIGMVLVFKDITAQREVQEALYRSEERLRQVQKIEALGQLAGGVAHDFNNLMTVVIGYSRLLLADCHLNDPERAKIEHIQQAAEHATTLTRHLLAFSRKQVLHPQWLDINTLISKTAKILGRLLGEDILLQMSLAPTLDLVHVDPVQIEQVLLNLAANARDAMPRGGSLIFSTDTVELDEHYTCQYPDARPGQYVLLTVSDTGVGMDQDTLGRIFEPFFTTKEVGKGTGLGLSTVYGIVKQSGGHITVYGEPGRGTTFKIYLPIAPQPAPAAAPPTALPMVGGTETLLVVEDNVAIRNLVVTILRDLHYTVLEASTGADALQISAAHAGPIHLLLTDVVMPEMDGQEVAEQLVARRPDLKVLYMSGYAEAATASYGVLPEGTGFLPKPFTPEQLAQRVRVALDSPGTEQKAL
jgi:two-component system cell cycle sensor histidine kinase/response regulator CckA